MRTRLLLLPMAVLGLVLTACVPESKNPLSDPQNATQDTSLYGLWAMTLEDGSRQYIHIGAEPEKPVDVTRETPEPGLMKYWFIGHDAGNKQVSKPFGMRFFVTKIGDETFANALYPFDEQVPLGETQNYWFIKYRATPDTLEFTAIDWKGTAAVIENGGLTGTVERNPDGELSKVTLTDTTENIVGYLKAGGSHSLFPEQNKAVYQRVK